MVCRECEWSETGRGGGSKDCTVVACRAPSVFHSFFRCGKYFCSELQMLYGRGMPRPISLRAYFC